MCAIREWKVNECRASQTVEWAGCFQWQVNYESCDVASQTADVVICW